MKSISSGQLKGHSLPQCVKIVKQNIVNIFPLGEKLSFKKVLVVKDSLVFKKRVGEKKLIFYEILFKMFLYAYFFDGTPKRGIELTLPWILLLQISSSCVSFPS